MTDAEVKYFKANGPLEKATGRISEDRVRESFGGIGKTPKQGVFDSESECCGLVAVWLAEKRAELSDHYFRTCFGHEFNVSRHYMEGFMSGWDGNPPSDDLERWSPNWQKGYDDGLAAWRACRHMARPCDDVNPITGQGDEA